MSIVASAVLCAFTYSFNDAFWFRYMATMEESMVDTAHLLAAGVEQAMENEEIPSEKLRALVERLDEHTFTAKIYEMTKRAIALRIYATDKTGMVVFDSDSGRDEGKDYSNWNDVYLTLQGKYGVRASQSNPHDPWSTVLYVSAPIRHKEKIVGCLTVSKPSGSIQLFEQTAKRQISIASALAILTALWAGLLVSFWVSRPIEKLTQYTHAVRTGKPVQLPNLGKSEIGLLGEAFEQMREALEGKQYVEEYVQSLTHQIKNPLSAIRGVAELLDENMPQQQRRVFLKNLRTESMRIEDLVARMLALAALENRRKLRDIQEVELKELLSEILQSLQPLLTQKSLHLSLDFPTPVHIEGECFLLRQAFFNLLQNAIDFSTNGGKISVVVSTTKQEVEIRIADSGVGIPDYALSKIFDRFYSLQRPDSERKSSGLGLPFVREVITLHKGSIALKNRAQGGAVALCRLPLPLAKTGKGKPQQDHK